MMKGTTAPGTALSFIRLMERLLHREEGGRLSLKAVESEETAWVEVAQGKMVDARFRDLEGDAAIRAIKDVAKWDFEFPANSEGNAPVAAGATSVSTQAGTKSDQPKVNSPLKLSSGLTLKPLMVKPAGGAPSELAEKPQESTEGNTSGASLPPPTAKPVRPAPILLTSSKALVPLPPKADSGERKVGLDVNERIASLGLKPLIRLVPKPTEQSVVSQPVESAPEAADVAMAPALDADVTPEVNSLAAPEIEEAAEVFAEEAPLSVEVEWPESLPESPGPAALAAWAAGSAPWPGVARIAFNEEQCFGPTNHEEAAYFRGDYGFLYSQAYAVGQTLGFSFPLLTALAEERADHLGNPEFVGRATAYKALGGDLVLAHDATNQDLSVICHF